jgi:hypothetical protein
VVRAVLILISAILFAIGISLLALGAALLALKIVLWIIMVVLRLMMWLLGEKNPEPVQVKAPVSAQVEAAYTYMLTQNKDGTWVLK